MKPFYVHCTEKLVFVANSLLLLQVEVFNPRCNIIIVLSYIKVCNSRFMPHALQPQSVFLHLSFVNVQNIRLLLSLFRFVFHFVMPSIQIPFSMVFNLKTKLSNDKAFYCFQLCCFCYCFMYSKF